MLNFRAWIVISNHVWIGTMLKIEHCNEILEEMKNFYVDRTPQISQDMKSPIFHFYSLHLWKSRTTISGKLFSFCFLCLIRFGLDILLVLWCTYLHPRELILEYFKSFLDLSGFYAYIFVACSFMMMDYDDENAQLISHRYLL